MKDLTLGQIFDGIRRRDNEVLTLIYQKVYPKVRSYVLKNGGSQDDAKDTFQESIIIIFRLLEENTLKLEGDFFPYLYGVASRVWLKQMRSQEIHNRNVALLEEPEHTYIPLDRAIDDDLEMKLFRKHFLRLGEECKKVLQLITDGVDYEVIARIMEYKSEKIARNKKYKCKETLIEWIKNDPEYRQLRKDGEI